jgi:hypothetical protein
VIYGVVFFHLVCQKLYFGDLGFARGMDKRELSERDICTKFITPALRSAGWDEVLQIREEVSFTKGRIIVRGKPKVYCTPMMVLHAEMAPGFAPKGAHDRPKSPLKIP